MNRDLTKGSVLKSMLLFSIPMILGDLLQQCYNIVEVNHLKSLELKKEALTLKLNLLLNLYSSFCIPFVIFILRFVSIIIKYLFSVNISNF